MTSQTLDQLRTPANQASDGERVAKSFKDYEHEGWNSKASQYERVTLPITRQGFEPILTSFGDLRGKKLLDVCTGPGEEFLDLIDKAVDISTHGDAAASGLVKNIARPEGNITGFSTSEPMIGGKWLELLKAAAPHITRVAIAFNPDLGPTAPSYIASIDAAAQKLAVKTVKVPFHDAVELVRSLDAFAAEPNGGMLLLPPSPLRATVLKLAAQHRLPAMYPLRTLVSDGGLLSYSTDFVEQNRRAASYVDRILRGTKVADLPVQLPTKYQLAVNVRTAKAIGLTIPEAFLLLADELIE